MSSSLAATWLVRCPGGKSSYSISDILTSPAHNLNTGFLKETFCFTAYRRRRFENNAHMRAPRLNSRCLCKDVPAISHYDPAFSVDDYGQGILIDLLKDSS